MFSTGQIPVVLLSSVNIMTLTLTLTDWLTDAELRVMSHSAQIISNSFGDVRPANLLASSEEAKPKQTNANQAAQNPKHINLGWKVWKET